MLLMLGLRTGKGQGGDPKIRWYLVLTYIRSDDYNDAHVRVTPIWLSGHHEDAEGLGNLHKSAGHYSPGIITQILLPCKVKSRFQHETERASQNPAMIYHANILDM